MPIAGIHVLGVATIATVSTRRRKQFKTPRSHARYSA